MNNDTSESLKALKRVLLQKENRGKSPEKYRLVITFQQWNDLPIQFYTTHIYGYTYDVRDVPEAFLEEKVKHDYDIILPFDEVVR